MELLVTGGRLVGQGDAAPERPADVRIRDGMIVEVGPGLSRGGAEVLDVDGGWLIPGLWDAHVHFGQWVRSTLWLDVSGTPGPESVCALISAALAARPDDEVLTAFGYRSAGWDRLGTVAELDAVSGHRPVIAISGDAHNGWLNSAALRLAGLPPREGPLAETAWFDAWSALSSRADPTQAELAVAMDRLAARGLVGIVDMDMDGAFRAWPTRSRGTLRVRAAVYPHLLDEVVAAGLRTGDALSADGLVTMGPLKVIGDGSLGTRTAWCVDPYADDPGHHGGSNFSDHELRRLLARATAVGLEVAVHAIGDRAAQSTLDAFADAGASGSIEHAQLLRRADHDRFARLGITASVQPAHALDDRDLAEQVWADRTDRLFPLRSLLDAGAKLALGSDAPVAAPDPWLAMAAAVHRSVDHRAPWHPEEALTPAEALASSVDGRRLAVGQRGDVVALAADPLAWLADPASTTPDAHGARFGPGVVATVCAGRVTHR